MARQSSKNQASQYQPPARSCGKIRYATKQQAEAAADELMIIEPGLKLRVYKCLNCGSWHLTRVKTDDINVF